MTNLFHLVSSKCVIDIASHQRGGSIHALFAAALVITLAIQVLCRIGSVRLSGYTYRSHEQCSV